MAGLSNCRQGNSMENKYNYTAHKFDKYTNEEQSEYNAIMGVLMCSNSDDEMMDAGNKLQELHDKWYLRFYGKERGVKWIRNS